MQTRDETSSQELADFWPVFALFVGESRIRSLALGCSRTEQGASLALFCDPVQLEKELLD